MKVAGKRSIKPVQTVVKVLKDYFGNKHIRAIKTGDLENYKNQRLKTPIEIEVNQKIKAKDEKTGKTKTVTKKVKRISQRKVSSVNRELETLRAMFNSGVAGELFSPGLPVSRAGFERRARLCKIHDKPFASRIG